MSKKLLSMTDIKNLKGCTAASPCGKQRFDKAAGIAFLCTRERPCGKPIKTPIGVGGVVIWTEANGSKSYRWKYHNVLREEKSIVLGTYPPMTIKEAIAARDADNERNKVGIDPVQFKRDAKAVHAVNTGDTVAVIAAEWSKYPGPKGGTKAHPKVLKHILDEIGDRPRLQVTAPMVAALLQGLEAPHMKKRAFRNCKAIFRYAQRVMGKTKWNPCEDLDPPVLPKTTHRPALDVENLPEFLRDVSTIRNVETRLAVQLSLRLAVRRERVRDMKWSEIDFDKATWIVPPSKKKVQSHIVHLSETAIALLRELYKMNGTHKYVFGGKTRRGSNFLLEAIYDVRSNGTDEQGKLIPYYKGRMCAHGSKAIYSTWAKQAGFISAAVDRQLDQYEEDETKAAYDRGFYLDERNQSLERFSHALDNLERKT